MIVKKEVHTKCATSRRLSKALKDLVGQEAHFKVEMRHNVYNIECSKPFDLDELLRNCKGLQQKKPGTPDFEQVLAPHREADEST